jgi:hypothetical protein
MGLEELAYNLKWFFSNILDKPLKAAKNLLEQKTPRLIVLCAAALIVVIPLTIIITANIALSVQNKKIARENVFQPDPIAAEDIFIPEKPDFLPSIMLERQQREVWTSEDAAEFWTDPAEISDEFWRRRISDSLDRLLETLP